MLKTTLRFVLCAFILLTLRPTRCSTPASNSSWSWLTCATIGFAAITPYFAYKWYNSKQAEQTAKKKDDEVNAAAKNITDKLARGEKIAQEDTDAVSALNKKYPNPAFESNPDKFGYPEQQQEALSTAVDAYNFCPKERGPQNPNYDVANKLFDLLPFSPRIARRPVFLEKQQNTTSNYRMLTGLSGLTAAGLYLYGR